jgi:hypothetical protein
LAKRPPFLARMEEEANKFRARINKVAEQTRFTFEPDLPQLKGSEPSFSAFLQRMIRSSYFHRNELFSSSPYLTGF